MSGTDVSSSDDGTISSALEQARKDDDSGDGNGSRSGGGMYYGMYILGPMIRQFSENSIKSAEKLGGGLEKISQSVSSDCRHPDNVSEDEAGDDTSLINTRNRAFLDSVQARAPDLYRRFVAHARTVVESDTLAEAQVSVAIANFYDPVAYFRAEGDEGFDAEKRTERARKRNYRIIMPYMWLMYMSRLNKASSSPEALREYLERETNDAGTSRGRYSS